MKKEKMPFKRIQKFWIPTAIHLVPYWLRLSFGVESNMCMFLALLVFKSYFQITKSKGKMKRICQDLLLPS